LKELGEYLQEKRKDNGVGIDEVAEDLNLSRDDIENIEAGNVRAFKDVLKLKDKVREYAKYLGLDSEKVVDEFNDFLFEHTSKISLEDILDAKNKKEEEEKKIVSPYTHPVKRQIDFKDLEKLKPLLIVMLIVVSLLLVIFLFVINIDRNKDKDRNIELKGWKEMYEFA